MAKYHIGKDGVQRICNAKNKPCPYGATSEHYDSLEKATEVADKLNEILSKPDSYGMAKVGGTQVVDKNTEVAVLRLANAKQTISKLYEGNPDVFAINIVNALKLLSANNIQ